VAAARDGARRVARRGPGRRGRGALRQGAPPAAAAVRRPVGVRAPLLPVQPAELGPGREGRGAGEQELLPLPQGCCGCGFFLYLSNRSQRGNGRPCRQAKHATAMAWLRALLAAVVA